MKIKTTKKSIKESFSKVYSVSYCNLQWLLNYTEPFAYSTRKEGWACDYYRIGDVVISTGYAPIGSSVSYELQKKYDDMARDIVCDNEATCEQKRDLVENLINDFLKELEGLLL
jgi:hypothetical protein